MLESFQRKTASASLADVYLYFAFFKIQTKAKTKNFKKILAKLKKCHLFITTYTKTN